MTTTLIVLLSVFFVLIVLSVPISYSIGVASILALIVKDTISLQSVPQKFFSGLDSFTLLAIPLFIFVGDVMVVGGISKRLIALANYCVGWMRGGLAYVTIVASAFFGAISGSSVATTSAIGGLMYPEMVAKKYDKSFAAALGAVGGTLGILIPPSIAFIIFGTQSGTSVTGLFLTGGVIGIVIMVLYCIAAKVKLSKDTDVVLEVRTDTSQRGRIIREASWGLFTPIIILGGIYTGVFTPTESAIVASVYSILVGFFVYKELTIKNLASVLVKSAMTSAVILFLTGLATLFCWIMTIEGTSRMLQGFVTSANINKYVFLLIINLIYLVLGMLMDTIPIIILTTPIFLPIAVSFGIDPIHFGTITVVNLAFGLFTPPFGVCVFMANTYSKQPVAGIFSQCRYFFVFGLIGIFLTTYFPQIYMWVVR